MKNGHRESGMATEPVPGASAVPDDRRRRRFLADVLPALAAVTAAGAAVIAIVGPTTGAVRAPILAETPAELASVTTSPIPTPTVIQVEMRAKPAGGTARGATTAVLALPPSAAPSSFSLAPGAASTHRRALRPIAPPSRPVAAVAAVSAIAAGPPPPPTSPAIPAATTTANNPPRPITRMPAFKPQPTKKGAAVSTTTTSTTTTARPQPTKKAAAVSTTTTTARPRPTKKKAAATNTSTTTTSTITASTTTTTSTSTSTTAPAKGNKKNK